MSYKEYQGGKITSIPEKPGLYAWYYRPLSVSAESALNAIRRFFLAENAVVTKIDQRYGMKLLINGHGELVFGAEEQSAEEAIEKALSSSKDFLDWFFKSESFVYFSRPLYIGIAKNLYERVYVQHYSALLDYWSEGSQVSRFVNANPDVGVQGVMDKLGVNHSFALEARVRCIPPRDLMVAVLETDTMPKAIGVDTDSLSDESSTRRSLERLLQLMADPICGRR